MEQIVLKKKTLSSAGSEMFFSPINMCVSITSDCTCDLVSSSINTHTCVPTHTAHNKHTRLNIVNISWPQQRGWEGFMGCHRGPENPALISVAGRRARAGRTSTALYWSGGEREGGRRKKRGWGQESSLLKKRRSVCGSWLWRWGIKKEENSKPCGSKYCKQDRNVLLTVYCLNCFIGWGFSKVEVSFLATLPHKWF